ncbi:MAG: alpha/beta hydrolase [Planctomycetes bacterium]|nr:alpha/beta hydrolase [Planctomycetota bacterium]
MPIFEHDSIRFHYEVLGEGYPLVMCHGLTGDLDAPKDLLGELPGYRLIFLDARAHGKTEPVGPVSKLCFKQFASDLHALLEHLKIDRAIVGGISMGAAIAARFAIDFPKHVAGLILLRPAWCDTPSPENLKWCPLLAQLFEQHGKEKWRQAYVEHPVFQELQKTDLALYEFFHEEFGKPLAIERRERLVRIPGDCPIQNWQEVESLEVPALVIGSDHDTLHPLGMAEAWAEHLPQGRLEHAVKKSSDLQRHTLEVRNSLRGFLKTLGS